MSKSVSNLRYVSLLKIILLQVVRSYPLGGGRPISLVALQQKLGKKARKIIKAVKAPIG